MLEPNASATLDGPWAEELNEEARPGRSAPALSGARPIPSELTRLQAGDAALLQQVLADLLPFVRTLMFRMLGGSPQLDDAVQDALIELASALRRYEGRSSLRSYAGPIVVRVAYRYFRKRSRDREHVDSEDAELHEPSADAEARCMDRQSLRRLYACLDELSGHHRAAFVLCEVEGMTPAEAARLMRVHPITLRSHLMRARHALRKRLLAEPALHGWLLRGER